MSENGGQQPVWARDGRELFYLEGNKIMAVSVQPGPQFAFRPAMLLFDRPYYHVDLAATAGLAGLAYVRTFDVAPDGQHVTAVAAAKPIVEPAST